MAGGPIKVPPIVAYPQQFRATVPPLKLTNIIPTEPMYENMMELFLGETDARLHDMKQERENTRELNRNRRATRSELNKQIDTLYRHAAELIQVRDNISSAIRHSIQNDSYKREVGRVRQFIAKAAEMGEDYIFDDYDPLIKEAVQPEELTDSDMEPETIKGEQPATYRAPGQRPTMRQLREESHRQKSPRRVNRGESDISATLGSGTPQSTLPPAPTSAAGIPAAPEGFRFNPQTGNFEPTIKATGWLSHNPFYAGRHT